MENIKRSRKEERAVVCTRVSNEQSQTRDGLSPAHFGRVLIYYAYGLEVGLYSDIIHWLGQYLPEGPVIRPCPTCGATWARGNLNLHHQTSPNWNWSLASLGSGWACAYNLKPSWNLGWVGLVGFSKPHLILYTSIYVKFRFYTLYNGYLT